jgi:hypothetical protein
MEAGHGDCRRLDADLRTAGSFGVELDGEEGFGDMLAALIGAIVGVDKQRLPSWLEAVGINRKPVVLRGDVTAFVLKIDARLVLATIAEG